MSSLWSSFVGYFFSSDHGTPSVNHLASSPSTQNGEAEGLILELLEIYGKLKARKCLKPCDEVDGLFGKLVDMCILNRSSKVTAQILQDLRFLEIRTDLRHLCDKAECCLETHSADNIIGNGNSTPEEVYQRLTSFPYFQNYVDLTRLELSTINGVRNSPNPISKIAFLGSGPLPLTSLCLCGAFGDPLNLPNTSSSPISVLNIDLNPIAISQSQNLCQALGPRGNGMSFTCTSAGSPDVDLKEFDIVYLAALVGSSQTEKEKVLVDVVKRMKEGALLVVRSADRLRRLMYPAFDPSSEMVRRWLDILAVVHPYNHVVNSVVIGRARGCGGEEGSV
ncbi:related to nicotianamine synthase [Phialocephala subalpina]|uniref:Related to nicotianamine synthase n=1 Tax=Phialocephala subalpina TaxID=576137 RepID=A0A1L7XX25_9HELO|nr:related to nicotianamine synthase [Phialocephala subalpina]